MARHQTRYVSLAPLFHTYTRPNLGLFCSRYYIGIGYTSLSIRFFLFSFFFSIDNWTRDLSGRNDLGVLIERELFFLFSNVYDLTTRSRLGLNISIRCYIRRIIHSGKEFSWLVKREEQKTLSQRRVFNPPRISPSMRISYRSEEGRNSKEKGLLSPPTPRKQTRWIPRRHPRKSITSSSIPPVSILLSLHAPRHQRYPSDETVTISSRP